MLRQLFAAALLVSISASNIVPKEVQRTEKEEQAIEQSKVIISLIKSGQAEKAVNIAKTYFDAPINEYEVPFFVKAFNDPTTMTSLPKDLAEQAASACNGATAVLDTSDRRIVTTFRDEIIFRMNKWHLTRYTLGTFTCIKENGKFTRVYDVYDFDYKDTKSSCLTIEPNKKPGKWELMHCVAYTGLLTGELKAYTIDAPIPPTKIEPAKFPQPMEHEDWL